MAAHLNTPATAPAISHKSPTTPHENMGTFDTFWEIMLPLHLSNTQFRAIKFPIQNRPEPVNPCQEKDVSSPLHSNS
jgi:hypothetical protein